MRDKFFEEIDFNFSGAVVFLDVDGTLRADGEREIHPNILEKVAILKANNDVCLSSNKDKKISERKPRKKAAGDIDLKNKPIVVIGDKFLTDFLFAKNIGADFIMVKRKVSGREPIFVKFTYLVDNILYKLWNFL